MKRFIISNLRNNGSLKRGARKHTPIALCAGMALICVHSSAFADAIPATYYGCPGPLLTVKYNTSAIGELSLSVAHGGKPIVKRGRVATPRAYGYFGLTAPGRDLRLW
jgi:hypothetical protein